MNEENEKGYYVTEVRIKESATPVDDITKFAYYDDDYEEVQVWHEYTAEEIAEQEAAAAAQEQQEMIEALPDAVADLSTDVSNNATDLSDIADAVAELSQLVSEMKEVNNG